MSSDHYRKIAVECLDRARHAFKSEGCRRLALDGRSQLRLAANRKRQAGIPNRAQGRLARFSIGLGPVGTIALYPVPPRAVMESKRAWAQAILLGCRASRSISSTRATTFSSKVFISLTVIVTLQGSIGLPI